MYNNKVFLIKTDCGLYDHIGILTKESTVISLNRSGFVIEEDITSFLAGRTPQLIQIDTDYIASVEHARRLLGYSGYNLALWNCEHFVNLCCVGRGYSPQVDTVLMIIIIIVLVLVLTPKTSPFY